MNRTALCGFFVGLAALSLGQDLTRKISIEIPASRATSALAELSKAAGITFQPAANLKDDVFVISAHDATVDDVMKRIAKAENGVWSLQSGIYFLARDRTTGIEQERAEIKARAAALSESINKLRDRVDAQAPFSEATATQLSEQAKNLLESASTPGGRRPDFSAAADKTPATRAIAHLLASIDASKLALIGPGQRVVFSTNPTSMQQSLNNTAFGAFRQFVSEQQIYTQAYNSAQPQDGQTRMIMMNGFGTPSMGNGDPKLGLGVGLVIVQRRFGNGLDIQIIAADPNLDTLATGNYSLQLPLNDPKANTKEGEQPLQLSTDAMQIAKAMGSGPGGAGGPVMMKSVAVASSGKPGSDFAFQVMGPDSASANIKISPELRAKILNPEQFDPLSFVPGEAIVALAKERSANVVALLPDSCFASMGRQFSAPVTASQLISALGPTHGLRMSDEDGWLVISPALPFSARVSAASRPALGTLLRKMEKTGWLSLDDVVAFAMAESRTPTTSDLDILYPRLINASVSDRQLVPLATGSYSAYKFYGTLSDVQRRAVTVGQNIPFSALGPQQIALVADLVFNSPGGPQVDTGQAFPDLGAGNLSVTVRSERGGPSVPVAMFGGFSAKTERTIVLPNGITAEGFLQGSISSQQIVQAMNTQTGTSAMLDASSLALARAAVSDPNLAGMASNWDRFKPAHQTDIGLRFVLSPRVSLARSISDQAPDNDVQAVSYDALPAGFRQQVDEMAARMQQAFGKIPGRGGQNPPPPSR